MPSLKEQIDAKKAQKPTIHRNPEIDAKLDRFIEANPSLREYYEQLTKGDLIRKLMLGKMQKAEYATSRNQEIRSWIEQNPDAKAKVEERIKNVPEANRERAFINAARREAVNQVMKGPRLSQ